MAIVPQITMRSTALPMLEPPVLADTAPRTIRERMVKPYRKYSILSTGANKVTAKGKRPPVVKAAP